MKRYVAKCLFLALITVAVALVINFILIHLAPGNPVQVLAGSGHPSPEMEAALTVKYGLDKPLYVQFFTYIRNLLRLDLGNSYVYNQPVTDLIWDRFGPSSLLALTSAVLAMVLGTLLGLVTAPRRGSVPDRIINSVSYFFYSMPSFWLGLMVILLFSSTLKILPTSGMESLRTTYTGFAHAVDVGRHKVLPVGTLTVIQIHRIGSQGSMNFSMYANPEVDEMFAQAAVLADQDARAKIYKDIQDICAEEFIFVPLSEDITVSVYKDYLDGLPYQNDEAAQTEMSYVT